MNSTRALLPALGMVFALGGAATAQTSPTPAQPLPPPSPSQAAALEQQITEWLTSVTAGMVTMPPRPVEFQPEADHYNIRVPLAPLAGQIDPADAAFTGKARQLDGTRWSLDDQQFPPNLTIKTTETVADPPDPTNPNPAGTHTQDVTYRIKLGQQDLHSNFDTSLGTPTTSGGTVMSVDLEKEGGTGASLTHIGQVSTQTSTRPVDASRADVLSDATAQDYSVQTDMPDGTQFSVRAERLHVVSTLSGLAHDQLVPVFRLLGQTGTMLKEAGSADAGGPTAAQKAALHDMLQKARDILTGVNLDESIEGAKFELSGNSGSVKRAEIDIAGDAPAEALSASMAITLDGLVLDDLPPTIAAYVPSHFAIRPTLSNLNVAALTQMGLDATAPVPDGQPAPHPDIASLFANGGIKFGFDSLALDVVGTHLSGTGSFTSTGPKSINGEADFTARGLDALIAKAQSDPMLQQAVPVVIFLKGIARTTGDQAVWQVTVSNAKVLVNGVDLSALAGGMR